MNLSTIELRLRDILSRTAEFQRACKACSVPLWFVRHSNGVLTPYTEDGTNHFANCPEAAQFKRKPVERAE